MILIIKNKATQQQKQEMLEELDPIIKLAVDVSRNILAGGGLMHADCEAALIEDGSKQENIWGANWIPGTRTIEYEALINIRPHQNNYAMTIENPNIRRQVEAITKHLLEGL